MAQSMHFDFQSHKNCGMGVIRNFVRQQSALVGVVKSEVIFEPEIFLDMGDH